jgi:hypothetical protein
MEFDQKHDRTNKFYLKLFQDHNWITKFPDGIHKNWFDKKSKQKWAEYICQNKASHAQINLTATTNIFLSKKQ